jgi:hypothetical protein
MTPEFTIAKAKLMNVKLIDAKITRTTHLKERGQDLKNRLNTAVSLYWSETSLVGQELLLERVILPHSQQLHETKKELEAWSKSVKTINMKTLDWDRASQYPCTDLLGQPVRKHGAEWIYHSPHREDKKPSFSVNIQKNIWHDWGSNEGGNVFDLYMLIHNTTKVEACKQILAML